MPEAEPSWQGRSTRTWVLRTAVETDGELFRTAAAMGAAGTLERALLAHHFRDVYRATGPRAWSIPFLAVMARLLGRSLPTSEVKDS